MKNVAVFFGGVSCEHDISIITGLQAIAALDKSIINVFPVYISKSGKWFFNRNFTDVDDLLNFDEKKHKQVLISAGQPYLFVKKPFGLSQIAKLDCALICCHGMNGEDGTLQGILELCKIPYTSSGVLGSAICMDKIIMKMLFEVNNFPITNYEWFNYEDFEKNKTTILNKIEANLEYPLMVKPANLGSSIGISRCENKADLLNAIDIAANYDSRILIEEAVVNLREINCACFGDTENVLASELEEPISWQKFLSFDEKYLHFSGMKFEKNKLDLNKKLKTEIKKISMAAFKSLNCAGVVRIDFLLDAKTEDLFINEINTIPGSLASYLWEPKSYTCLLNDMIDSAEKRFLKKQQFKFTYDSDALKNYKNKNKLKKFKK